MGVGQLVRVLATLVCVGVGLLLAFAAPAGAVVQGVLPGEFRYSLHDPVPLVPTAEPEPPAEFEKEVDPFALFGAPAVTQAGAHPDLTLAMVTRTGEILEILEGLDTTTETEFELPPGVLAGLGQIPSCPTEAFERIAGEVEAPDGCPADTQIGVVGALWGGELQERTYPLYKVQAAPGQLAVLGFPYAVLGRRVPMTIAVSLDTEGEYRLDLTRQNLAKFREFLPAPFMTIWGVPGAPAHDAERINPEGWKWGTAVPGPHPPLIDSLAGCGSGPSEARLRLAYKAGELSEATEKEEREEGVELPPVGHLEFPESSEDPAYRAFAPEGTGCAELPFAPRADLELTSARVDSAAGLKLRLHLPQAQSGAELATSPPREVSLTLPPGVSLNPAAAEGLVGCTADQVGLEGTEFPASEPVRFAPGPEHCPDASKLGTVVFETPLTEAPLSGSVYLAKPFENPSGSRWGIYLAAEGPGFTVKVPGHLDIDPESGRLVLTIAALPQLPLEGIALDLAERGVGFLSTPPTCGTRSAEARVTPWTPASGATVAIDQRLEFEPFGGGSCPAGRSPFSPRLAAQSSTADASPLELRIERPAGDQPLKRITVAIPSGLVASLGGRRLCGENEIATAEERSVPGGGAVEAAEQSCPAASRVGSLVAATGTGQAPLTSTGALYLAGPYKGAPYSLVAITPVVADMAQGAPLVDLGTMVDRAALRLDPRTAQLEIESDALPEALDGIPLDISALTFDFDGQGFLRAPTSCLPQGLTAGLEGGEGSRVDLAAEVGASNCGQAQFGPSLRVSARGEARVGGHPLLTTTIAAPGGDAGVSAARVTFPPAIQIDPKELTGACRSSVSAWANCPPGSIVGHAVAWTSLAEEPLEGPVRLLASPFASPTLGISLEGGIPLEFNAALHRRGGSVQLRLGHLPDVSLTRLTISIGAGRKSVFVNRRELCARRAFVEGGFAAYNGKIVRRRSAMRIDCHREE